MHNLARFTALDDDAGLVAKVLPQQAVLQGAQGFFVWIVDAEGKAQVRSVGVGEWQGDNWFISRGLSAGDKVVTDGLMRLAKGVQVKIVEKGTGDPGKTTPADKAKTASD